MIKRKNDDKKESRGVSYKLFMGIMVILTFVGAVISLISPVLLEFWGNQDEDISRKNILFLFLILLLSMALKIVLINIKERFAKYYNIQNFESCIEKFFHMEYDEIIKNGPTNLVERIQIAVNHIYEFITGSNIQIWSSVIAIVFMLFLIFANNIGIGFILLAVIPLNYVGYKLLNKELARRSEILQKESASGFQKIISYVGQTDYLKQCSDYKILLEQMHPAMEQLYGSMMDINIFAASASGILLSINEMAKILVMVLCIYQFYLEESNPFIVMMMAILFPIYFEHISIITKANLDKQGMLVSKKFIEEMEQKREKDGSLECDRIDKIELNIHTLKAGERILNRNINGIYYPGDVVWVKGSSGSGKSSLVKLLPKFRKTDDIRINGVELSKIKNESVRKRVCYMSQNVPIVKGTLRDNLFLNKKWSRQLEEDLKKEKIMEGLLSRIGMDDMVEEFGANLSGGEKQKIAIARLLNDDIDVLILDEITSSVDKENADKILERIFDWTKDKIVFIISHDDLPEKYATCEIIVEAEII